MNPTHIAEIKRGLSLPEMLADEIIQAVMKSDGVSAGEIESLIKTTHCKLESGKWMSV